MTSRSRAPTVDYIHILVSVCFLIAAVPGFALRNFSYLYHVISQFTCKSF
jgi:cytochrome b subunit of formate dehydrogenase